MLYLKRKDFMNNYQIYSGFCRTIDTQKYGGMTADEWYDIWWKNTTTQEHTYINIFGPDTPINQSARQIAEYPNLGYIGDYIHGKLHGKWCGWSAGVVFGMMHAYINQVDFLYKEQDCLWFGDGIIDQMYKEIGDKDIIFGSCKLMAHAQSLFLVKRDAIPDIISQLAQNDDSKVLPEAKFGKLMNSTKLSFGYDRDRPFNISDRYWYIQQVSESELNILQENKLL